MAVRNVGGHNVTNVLPPHSDAVQVKPGGLQTPDNVGKSGYNGGSMSGGNFPGKGKSKVPSSAPAQGQTGVAWAGGAGNS